MRRTSFRLDGDVNAIGAAREHVSEFLARAEPAVSADVLANVLLAVSELVTNAVRYAPGPCGLEVELDQRRVRIGVSDTSASIPTLKEPRYDGSGGFGLHMLRALAGEVETRPNGLGKTVSVSLALVPA